MSFVDLDTYPEFKLLQKNCETICTSLNKVTRWLDWHSDAMNSEGACMFLEGDWKASPVYMRTVLSEEVLQVEDGRKFFEKLPSIYPKITDLLKQIPSIHYAGFSKLGPRTQLSTHCHDRPNSLTLHMGLQIPRCCGLQVGKVRHEWRRKGQMVIFDDTQEHCAWNLSNGERVVFYVDFEKGSED